MVMGAQAASAKPGDKPRTSDDKDDWRKWLRVRLVESLGFASCRWWRICWRLWRLGVCASGSSEGLPADWWFEVANFRQFVKAVAGVRCSSDGFVYG